MHNNASILALHLLRPSQTVNGETSQKIPPNLSKPSCRCCLHSWAQTSPQFAVNVNFASFAACWSCIFPSENNNWRRKRGHQEDWSTCFSQSHRWRCATSSRTSPKLSTRFHSSIYIIIYIEREISRSIQMADAGRCDMLCLYNGTWLVRFMLTCCGSLSRQGIEDQFQRNAWVSTPQDLDAIWHAPSYSVAVQSRSGWLPLHTASAGSRKIVNFKICQMMQLDVIMLLSLSVMVFIPFHTCH